MPPLRLFITPSTDRSVSYSAAKVKVFWAKQGPQLMVPENFASSTAYETANRTVLGPKKRFGSMARFMLQAEGIRRRRKRQWLKPRSLDAASFPADNGRGWKDAPRRYLVPVKTREEFSEQEMQYDKKQSCEQQAIRGGADVGRIGSLRL
jgi:hypothetical protein